MLVSRADRCPRLFRSKLTSASFSCEFAVVVPIDMADATGPCHLLAMVSIKSCLSLTLHFYCTSSRARGLVPCRVHQCLGASRGSHRLPLLVFCYCLCTCAQRNSPRWCWPVFLRMPFDTFSPSWFHTVTGTQWLMRYSRPKY